MFLAYRMAAVANPFSCPKLAFYSFQGRGEGGCHIDPCSSSDLCEWSGNKKLTYVYCYHQSGLSADSLSSSAPMQKTHVKRGTMSDYEMKEVRAAEYAGCDIIFCRKQNPVFMKKERLNSPETHILLPSFLPALRNEDEELWLCLEFACVKSISFQYSMFPLFYFILCSTIKKFSAICK